jgi:hypothetical protein
MTPAILTTRGAISAVYDWLGRPDQALLPPTIVCTKYWAQLDLVQQMISISDRTIYLKQAEVTLATNEQEKDMGELELFGTPLGLESVDRASGIERTCPVPLISDMRQINGLPEVAAFLYRDGSNGNVVIRFNQPLAATTTFRLWYDPAGYGRPGLKEVGFLPPQAVNYVVIETADSCTPDIRKVYEVHVAQGYEVNIEKQRQKFRQAFLNWAMKDPSAGSKHRKAFNESRRASAIASGRGPIISE